MLIAFRGADTCLQDQRVSSAYSEIASEGACKRHSTGRRAFSRPVGVTQSSANILGIVQVYLRLRLKSALLIVFQNITIYPAPVLYLK